MAALEAAIQRHITDTTHSALDGRVKPGHDVRELERKRPPDE
jgi:hypothetical protein